MMNLNKPQLAMVGFLAVGMVASAQTLSAQTTFAYWNFDQGAPGEPFSNADGATLDVEDQSGNGFWLSGWNSQFGPSFSQLGDTPSGTGLSSRHNGQDAFTGALGNEALNTWSPLAWTIEVSVRLDNPASPNQTIIGRDGNSFGGFPADFYLQTSATGSSLRLDFNTVGNERITIDSDFAPVANQWYGLAAVSDGVDVFLYANKLDGNGYQVVGSQSFVGVGADNALASPDTI